MNKTELIAAMAEISSLSKKDCEAALTAFVAATENALKAGDKVQLVGFGTFEPRYALPILGVIPLPVPRSKFPLPKLPPLRLARPSRILSSKSRICPRERNAPRGLHLPDLPRHGGQIHPAGLKQSESACRSS